MKPYVVSSTTMCIAIMRIFLLSILSYTVEPTEIPNDDHFNIPNNNQQYDRLSTLDFSSQSEHDSGEHNELLMAKSSFWGRLFLDGFPDRKGIQYFRAHFGSTPPENGITLTLASPNSLCEEDGQRSTTKGQGFGSMANLIVVALRGNCTFEEKARIAEQNSARGVLIVNNEEGNFHASGSENYGLNISVTMINKYDGQRLIKGLQQKNLAGKFVPMVCNQDSSTKEKKSQNYCEEVRSTDKSYVAELNFTGILTTSLGVSYSYKQGAFGSRLEYDQPIDIWRPNDTLDLCSNNTVNTKGYKHKAILVDRGGCDFATKAEALSNMGASLMLLVNYDDSIMTMGVDSDYRGSKIEIASVMIPKSAGDFLLSSSEKVVSISLS